jgi:hypothetical protein
VGETASGDDAGSGDMSHPGVMAAATTPPLPGSMTVPIWYGWEVILGLLLLAVLGAVVFFLVTASGSAPEQRSEWRAFLAARSTATEDADADH